MTARRPPFPTFLWAEGGLSLLHAGCDRRLLLHWQSRVDPVLLARGVDAYIAVAELPEAPGGDVRVLAGGVRAIDHDRCHLVRGESWRERRNLVMRHVSRAGQ